MKSKCNRHLCCGFIDVHFPFELRVKWKRSDQLDEIVMLGDGFIVARSIEARGTVKNFPAVGAGHGVRHGRDAFFARA